MVTYPILLEVGICLCQLRVGKCTILNWLCALANHLEEFTNRQKSSTGHLQNVFQSLALLNVKFEPSKAF